MDLSQSNPAEFAALFMTPAQVDGLVVRDTTVVAGVAAGQISQSDRLGEAIKFFRHVLAIAYLLGSAIELGCKTIGDASARLVEVHSRAGRLLGFDPFAALDLDALASSADGASITVSPEDTLLPREYLRNLVSSVLASTDLATLLDEASSKGRVSEVFELIKKLNRFLRRMDAFSKQRVRVLAEKYTLGELRLAQVAEILGVDEDEALGLLSGPATIEAERKTLYRAHPEDETDLAAALVEVADGSTVELSADELEAWESTGELPDSVETRLGGCH